MEPRKDIWSLSFSLRRESVENLLLIFMETHQASGQWVRSKCLRTVCSSANDQLENKAQKCHRSKEMGKISSGQVTKHTHTPQQQNKTPRSARNYSI